MGAQVGQFRSHARRHGKHGRPNIAQDIGPFPFHICRPDHIATRCGIGDFQLVGLFPCQPQLFGFQFIGLWPALHRAFPQPGKVAMQGRPNIPARGRAFLAARIADQDAFIGLGANLTRGDAQEGGKLRLCHGGRYRLSDCHLIAGRLSAGSGGMGSRNQGRPLSGPLIMRGGGRRFRPQKVAQISVML